MASSAPRDEQDAHASEANPAPHAVLRLTYVVPALLIGIIVWVIWYHTPHVPWWDEWSYISLVEHANSGTLTWNDFWQLHFHTHRIVLPRAIDLTLIELTHWNVQVEMTFDLCVAVGSAALLFQCVRGTLRSDVATLLLVAPLSLLLFSLSQYADWFAPFQIAFVLAVFGVALCARALLDQPVGWRGFALAVAGALIASLSSFNGLTAWVVFFPSIARAGYRKSLLWMLSAASIIVPYSIGFPHQPLQVSVVDGIRYLLVYLGGPIGYPNYRVCEALGFVGLLLLGGNLYAYWRTHRSLWPIIIWIELALFAMITALLTTVGRGSDAPAGGMISRYQIFPALLWVVLCVLTAVNCRDAFARAGQTVGTAASQVPWRPPVATAAPFLALLLFCGATVLVNRAGFSEGLSMQEALVQHQSCIVHYTAAPDSCLGMWWPIGDKAANLRAAAYMQQHHLSIFGQAPQRP